MGGRLTTVEAQRIDAALAQSANGGRPGAQAPIGSENFRLMPIGAALAEPIVEVDWVINNLLAVGGMSLWVGKPFGGKSTALRMAALKVSRGEPFLGRATSKCAVGYFALEQARNEAIEHFRLMGATDADNANLKLHVGIVPLQDANAKLRQVIVENNLALAIIDPIVLLLVRGLDDLNDYLKVYAALEPLLSIARDTGCHLAIVHHMGKSERDSLDQVLGSTGLTAIADTVVTLRSKKVAGGIELRTIETQQRRAGINMQPTTITLDLVSGFVEIGEPLWVKKKEATFEAVLAFLKQQPLDKSFSLGELCDTLKLKRASVVAALKLGVEQRSVERSGSGKRGDALKYRALSNGGARNAPPSKPTLKVVKKRKFGK